VNFARARFRATLVGLAVGDALGTTVEFSPPGRFAPLTDMVGGGPFRLPAGAWTDDTSMALCLAESLVACRGFDPVDQLRRYVRWYREGYWSSTGTCFDIGGATRTALERFERTSEPFPGDAAPRAAGNGPLMKLAPVVLAYASRPADAVRHAAESARTTHGAPEAADACRLFAALLLEALEGAPADVVLRRRVDEPLHPKVAAVAAGSYLDREPPAIRGGGYVVEALEAALWAVRSTSTFQAAVLAAANLGDDADTTAAIAGQLAGALYGLEAIPTRWRAQLFMREEIIGLADELFEFDPLRVAELAHGVDGHARFGERWKERSGVARTQFFATGELPPDDEDVRALLALELAEADGDAEAERYRRALAARLRDQ
jgi:ADP-ribosylglycohydrolase